MAQRPPDSPAPRSERPGRTSYSGGSRARCAPSSVSPAPLARAPHLPAIFLMVFMLLEAMFMSLPSVFHQLFTLFQAVLLIFHGRFMCFFMLFTSASCSAAATAASLGLKRSLRKLLSQLRAPKETLGWPFVARKPGKRHGNGCKRGCFMAASRCLPPHFEPLFRLLEGFGPAIEAKVMASFWSELSKPKPKAN